MLTQIDGLHHVTSLARSAPETDRFMTQVLGLRRVKKTVNFDAPDVYHLYYGDAAGAPGTVMTYFPFPDAAPGHTGTGETGLTAYSVPKESLGFWTDRFAAMGVAMEPVDSAFGAPRLRFTGGAGDAFALIEGDDDRAPWAATVDAAHAIRGFHSVTLCLSDVGATADLLTFMGFSAGPTEGAVTRFTVGDGGAGRIVDLAAAPDLPRARAGAGSVHHVAFAVACRARQYEVREALSAAGWQVTPSIDRDYFHAIYFRSPGGVLFEVATAEPGFDRDEAPDALGTALKLPAQHEYLRSRLEKALVPLDA